MTEEKIIEIAKQSGIVLDRTKWKNWFDRDLIIEFANNIAEAITMEDKDAVFKRMVNKIEVKN